MKSNLAKKVFAYYYIWYNSGSWVPPPAIPSVTDTPSLGAYDSNDIAVIDQHIDWAKQAGLDGFLVSWGMYMGTNTLALIAERARLKGFKLGILGEWNGSMGTTEYLTELRYLINTYRNHPAFVFPELGGKMLIVPFLTDQHTLAFWTEVFGTLHSEGLDAFFLADWHGVPEFTVSNGWLDLFDGWTAYRPDAQGTAVSGDLRRKFTVDNRNALLAYPEPTVFMYPLCPGFDDSHFRTPGGNFPRDNGKYYQESYSFAREIQSDWLIIISFNEWYENSQVEPGTGLHSGTDPMFYLNLTKEITTVMPTPPILPILATIGVSLIILWLLTNKRGG